MPRENSFSDEDGRSLTPDLEDSIPSTVPLNPNASNKGRPTVNVLDTTQSVPASLASAYPPRTRSASAAGAMGRTKLVTPAQRFRDSVRKVMAMRRTSYVIARGGVGAEPGIDPRRESASLNYGHIRQKCVIEVADYSTTRSSFGRMTNQEFIRLMQDPAASQRESWVKVRWINVGGISWDVISVLAIKYSKF